MSDEPRDALSRRTFLKVAGAAGLLASCSPPAGPQKLLPYLVPPEEIIPGVPLLYRTVCRECPAGCGVTARTREGRVVKLEGNPDDPIGRGALCARGQAALQGLYAPDRFKGPMRRGADGALASVSWDDATAALAAALGPAIAKPSAAGVRMLTRPEPGATGALQREFMAKLGATPRQRVVLDPFDLAPLRAAGAIVFDRPELPVFDLSRARTVVSFGADFVETWLSPVELARDFAGGRGRIGEERTRLVWIGPRLCLTGVSADEWLSVRSGGELWVALALLRWLCDPANYVPGLAAEAGSLSRLLTGLDLGAAAIESGVAPTAIAKLAGELARRRPSAVLGPGVLSTGRHATELAVAIQLINWVLGNVGSTVLYGLDPVADPPSPVPAVDALLDDMSAGRVEVLLVHHADPAGALPLALKAAEAIGRVPLVVSFSDRPDATTQLARLILPDTHPLESFDAISARRGVVALSQPVMTPVADNRSACQVLIDVAAKLPAPAGPLPYDDAYAHFQQRSATLFPGVSGDQLAEAQRVAQQRGGVFGEVKVERVSLRTPDPTLLVPPVARQRDAAALDLVVFPTALRNDPSGEGVPWLREVPDVLSSVSWSPWAELAPATAARLGISDGDLVALTTQAGAVELSVCTYPGLHEGAVAVPMGGREPLVLLAAAADSRSGALAWQSGRATLTRTGRRAELPRFQGTPNQQGRTIVRTVSAAAPAVPKPAEPGKMVPLPTFPEHRWAMAIDMDRCTGCQACVVACYAENNVPVMGPEAMIRGRNMGWLRIEPFMEEKNGTTRVDLLPMMCQQCGNAPCEPVCPVYATYTNEEGLNAQVYNRCVGTRYCSNNCPYKVRVFNWAEPSFPEPLNMQLNPDVTVRSKGVMEKCTFCVQRIRAAENTARDERRPVRDGEVVPACAQTCPARAIVFGDADDPRSAVSALQRDGRGYNVLGELNTLPAITYLARVRDEDR
ncbi:MAG: 4Fe-4S dicluster domain-containing protein [Acidobacteriia bacterium]|nr:4Fe-4S dicluster domain-containing protein [Terriglobia bacterium]